MFLYLNTKSKGQKSMLDCVIDLFTCLRSFSRLLACMLVCFGCSYACEFAFLEYPHTWVVMYLACWHACVLSSLLWARIYVLLYLVCSRLYLPVDKRAFVLMYSFGLCAYKFLCSRAHTFTFYLIVPYIWISLMEKVKTWQLKYNCIYL